MQKLVFLAIVFAAFIEVAELFCYDVPIFYQERNAEKSEFKERLLKLHCSTDLTVSFAKLTQNFTLVYADKPTDLFSKQNYGFGARMVDPANPENPGVEILLFPEILNMNPAEKFEHNLTDITLEVRGLLKTMENGDHNETYVEAAPKEGKSLMAKTVRFRLLPGWVDRLESKQILAQTLVPLLGFDVDRQEVFVVNGHLKINKTEGFHAQILRDSLFSSEDVTIFFEKPDLDSEQFNPGYVDIQLKAKDENGETISYKFENAILRPGWFQELLGPSKQSLILLNQTTGAEISTVKVIAYPGHHYVGRKFTAGYEASIDLLNAYQQFVIFYDLPEFDNPEENPEIRRVMYQEVRIVPQANQSLVEQSILLSPGWFNGLKGSTLQTMRPLDDAGKKKNKNHFVEQRVTVTLGWNRFQDNSGFTAFYYYQDDNKPHPISVHLSVPPKPKQ